MEILKQEILHNNYCQQHNHAAVLSLLNHVYFESFYSHIIQVYIFAYVYIYKTSYIYSFLLSSTVMFFLHCMLNIQGYEKIFCEIDESIASQHDLSSDVTFLGVYSESIFHFMEYFFSQESCVSIGLIAESISLDTSAKRTLGFFFENYFSLLNNISLHELNSFN